MPSSKPCNLKQENKNTAEQTEDDINPSMMDISRHRSFTKWSVAQEPSDQPGHIYLHTNNTEEKHGKRTATEE